MLFPGVHTCYSVSSEPSSDSGSRVVGLGAFSSVKALATSSSSNEKVENFPYMVAIILVVCLHCFCFLDAAGLT